MEVSADCCFGDFEAAYYQSALPEMKEVERAVLGTDYGATSWMTRSQAESVLGALLLEPGSQHLELGSGSGWPGLYYSQQSGAEAVLLDIPLVALQQAGQHTRGQLRLTRARHEPRDPRAEQHIVERPRVNLQRTLMRRSSTDSSFASSSSANTSSQPPPPSYQQALHI